MKVTIIPADGAVCKDSICISKLDLSFVPKNVHALQWFDTKGWVEFVTDADFNKPANETIAELPEWAYSALALWEEAYAATQMVQV